MTFATTFFGVFFTIKIYEGIFSKKMTKKRTFQQSPNQKIKISLLDFDFGKIGCCERYVSTENIVGRIMTFATMIFLHFSSLLYYI